MSRSQTQTVHTRSGSPSGPTRSHTGLLLGLLATALITLVVMFPTLSRMREAATRLNREADAANARLAALRAASKAVDDARTAAASAPGDARAQLAAAIACANADRRDEALSYAELAARLAPSSVEPLIVEGDLYQRDRRFKDARDTYRAALTINPREARALTALGWLYTSFGWTGDALRLLEPAVAAQPGVPALHVALSLAYMQRNDYKRAEQQLETARQLSPGDPAVWAPLMDLYLKAFRPADAIRVANEGLAIRSNDLRSLEGLAQGLYMRGDITGAEAAARRTLRVEPKDLTALYYLGLSLKREGRSDDAIKGFEEVMALDPSYEQTELLLGQLYMLRGREPEGRKLLANYQENEGRGKADERIGLQLSMHTDNAALHLKRGQAYAAAGNTPRAIFELQRTLELDPSITPARALLAKLQSQPIAP